MKKIWLLIRKNLILRRRQWIVTALEILLPIILFVAVAYTNYEDVTSASTGDSASSSKSGDGPTIFPNLEEDDLKKTVCNKKSAASGTCVIAFAPENTQTLDVIEKVKACLPTTTPIPIVFKPFSNEEDIETFVAELISSSAGGSQSLEAAIIFDEGSLETGGGGGTVSYTIRQESKLSRQPLFPIRQQPGPNMENVLRYKSSGFIGLQLCIDKALMEKLTGRVFAEQISLQAFPYPPYLSSENFNDLHFKIIPLFFVMGFIFMVPSITMTVVGEKETGIRELLKLNGVRGWIQWVGWMVNSVLLLMISVTIVVILLFLDFGGGGVFQYSDPSVWWVVLLLYVMSATTYCFFICSFFSKPALATTVGIILWFALYQFPLSSLEKIYDTSSVPIKMAFALLPNMALHLALRVMSSFEGKAAGIQWSNIAEPISKEDPLSLLQIIFMLLLNTFLYMFLTIYLENVLPSEFGVRQPFYYIFQPSTYCQNEGVSNKVEDGEAPDQGGNSDKAGFEEESSTMPIGVDIRNLRKNFGANKIAVDGVSMKMYDGEIFALLGHNGAGKTTTISMITGMFAPSSGTAIVNGYDITKALDKARNYLGLCPQHNMLFDKLTVTEHLQFFGQLKGLSSSKAAMETKELLPKLQLTEKGKTKSKDLAGGQKRKLCLGMALIGGSKVVILDEPTSGMDPEARRVIWDLLLEMRGQRTILLTTHFMEEADVLGDRIGIMASGKLQCCGSSMYLKKFYGTGYTLKLSVTEDAKQGTILSLVKKYVPDASIKANPSNKLIEVIAIALPTETASTSILSEMFTDLEENKDHLGIKTVGLSLTSIDEVFLRVGELTESHGVVEQGKSKSQVHAAATVAAPSKASGVSKKSSSRHTKRKHDDDDDEEAAKVIKEDGIKQGVTMVRFVGRKLAMGQFIALITKKYIYSCCNWKSILPQLILPVVLISLAIWISRRSFETEPTVPPLKIGTDAYNNLVTLASASDPTISSHFPSVIGSSYKEAPAGKTVSEALLEMAHSNLGKYREKYIVALEVNSTNVHAMFNTVPTHAAPLAINLASNFLLKSLNPTSDWKINIKSHQLGSKSRAFLEETKRTTTPQVLLFGLFMPIGLGMLVASFIVFPIQEKICNAKQLQMMTGVSPLTYWYSAFMWDLFLVFLVVCAMTLCFPIFESHALFTSYWGAAVAFIILMVYGISSIWLSYLISLFASTIAGGFGLVSIMHVISGVILSLVVYGMESNGPATGGALSLPILICKWTGRILCPAYGAAISAIKFAATASRNSGCNVISKEAKSFLCDPDRNIDPKYRECCANCEQLPGVKCFSPEPYVTWKDTGTELLLMIVMATAYQVVLLFIECRVTQRLCPSGKGTVFLDNVTDEDVIAEKHRVADMVKNNKVDEDALVVEDLCKSYASFSAVSKLSFSVHHGECFGLLGVNGAGKTTTFRMLTGDEIRSCGNAYAFMKTLGNNRQEFLSNIGYCPQFDGIVGVLSGRQMLQLFGRLRGVPGNIGGVEADKWLEKMGAQDKCLDKSANVQCQRYSGGMKRRLSVAMAAIGDPPLMFLDEPTSGVDPVSRRQFWDVLGSIRDAGVSIILTSHSMDECEALCSRLAIMVNGQLQCIGGVQHLKNKFAQGYSLSLKLKSMISSQSEELSSLTQEIEEKLQPCTLKDKHLNACMYQLHNTSLNWAVLFKTMEEIKTKYEDIIEDYSMNETSLEEVFLSFARQQYGDRKTKASNLMRCLKCKCFS